MRLKTCLLLPSSVVFIVVLTSQDGAIVKYFLWISEENTSIQHATGLMYNITYKIFLLVETLRFFPLYITSGRNMWNILHCISLLIELVGIHNWILKWKHPYVDHFFGQQKSRNSASSSLFLYHELYVLIFPINIVTKRIIFLLYLTFITVCYFNTLIYNKTIKKFIRSGLYWL